MSTFNNAEYPMDIIQRAINGKTAGETPPGLNKDEIQKILRANEESPTGTRPDLEQRLIQTILKANGKSATGTPAELQQRLKPIFDRSQSKAPTRQTILSGYPDHPQKVVKSTVYTDCQLDLDAATKLQVDKQLQIEDLLAKVATCKARAENDLATMRSNKEAKKKAIKKSTILQTTNNDLLAASTEIEANLEACETETTRLKTELKQSQKERDQNTNDLSTLRQEYDKLTARNKKLTTQTTQSNQAADLVHEETKNELHEAEAENSQLRTDNAQLAHDAADLEDTKLALESKEKDLIRHETQVQAQEVIIVEQNGEIVNLTDQLESTTEHLTKEEEMNQKMEGKLIELRDKNNTLTQQLAQRPHGVPGPTDDKYVGFVHALQASGLDSSEIISICDDWGLFGRFHMKKQTDSIEDGLVLMYAAYHTNRDADAGAEKLSVDDQPLYWMFAQLLFKANKSQIVPVIKNSYEMAAYVMAATPHAAWTPNQTTMINALCNIRTKSTFMEGIRASTWIDCEFPRAFLRNSPRGPLAFEVELAA
jgi:hypothetical protein